jgi:hypothetical protein
LAWGAATDRLLILRASMTASVPGDGQALFD